MMKKFLCCINCCIAFFYFSIGQAPLQKISAATNVTKYLDEKKWNELFPNRYNISTYPDPSRKSKPKKDFYSFAAFVRAAKMFPKFLNEGDVIAQKRELAAFFANVSHETSGGWDDAPGTYYSWGLYYTEEKGLEKGTSIYSDTTKKKYLPIAGKSYHGRGPLQLSWNYNYAQFSQAYFGDQNILLQHPEKVTEDPVLCFASAIWFWMATQYPKPSCHDVICGKWIPNAKDSLEGRLPGFGAVVNVINGGLECGENHSDNTKYRYGFYQFYCNYFKVSPGNNAECSKQKRFGVK
jgi:hypothetical protein